MSLTRKERKEIINVLESYFIEKGYFYFDHNNLSDNELKIKYDVIINRKYNDNDAISLYYYTIFFIDGLNEIELLFKCLKLGHKKILFNIGVLYYNEYKANRDDKYGKLAVYYLNQCIDYNSFYRAFTFLGFYYLINNEYEKGKEYFLLSNFYAKQQLTRREYNDFIHWIIFDNYEAIKVIGIEIFTNQYNTGFKGYKMFNKIIEDLSNFISIKGIINIIIEYYEEIS